MKTILLLLGLFIITDCSAQNFDGFVVTESDSLFKGYMLFSSGPNGKKILITDNKKKKPRSYYMSDLKYYAYKKDTFALLNAFYPFEGEDYMASGIEGKYLISRGSVKLYHATFPDYGINGKPNRGVISSPGNYTPGVMGSPGTYTSGFINPSNNSFSAFVIKDADGNLFGIKGKKEEFFKFIEIALGDDEELMKRIQNKELGHKDIKKIVMIYNSNKLLRQ